MSRLPVLLLLLGLFAATATGCGGEPIDEPTQPGRWRYARLDGIEGASGLAAFESSLLISAGANRRVLYTVAIDDLAAGEAQAVRALPLAVDRGAALGGAGPFARQGYRLGDLWDLPVDVQGVAVQAPNFVFLAERNHRVVYAGRLRMGASRHLQGVQIDRVFVVPGADRSGMAAADWRDRGPGLAGLASVVGERSTEDLYAVDRSGASSETFRLQKLDRYGLGLGWFLVHVPRVPSLEVGGILKEAGRYLFVHGGGRGVIQPVVDGSTGQSVWAGRGVPGPDAIAALDLAPDDGEVGSWQGLSRGADGTLYLVSGGPRTILAWRPPPPVAAAPATPGR